MWANALPTRNQGQSLETTVGTLDMLGFTSALNTKNWVGYFLEKTALVA